jgi:hypothetical protein
MSRCASFVLRKTTSNKEKNMSAIRKTLLATAVLFAISINAHAQKNPEMKQDAQAVDSACKSDAATAGCGGEVVGKGLLKCLHAYKEAHKDYKFSEGCHEAMKHFREDRQAEKGGAGEK